MTKQGPGTCTACLRFFRDRISGYCPPCWDEVRELWDGPEEWGSYDDVAFEEWVREHGEPCEPEHGEESDD